jgi:hypothetical protein
LIQRSVEFEVTRYGLKPVEQNLGSTTETVRCTIVCRSHLTYYWQMFTAFPLFVVRNWKGSWSLQQRMGTRRNTSHRFIVEVYRGNVGMDITTLEEIACDVSRKMTV